MPPWPSLCAGLCVLVLLQVSPGICVEKKRIGAWRTANWTELITQPHLFVAKAHKRLRNRVEGYTPSETCDKFVGLEYLERIKDSGVTLCSSEANSGRSLAEAERRSAVESNSLPHTQSSVDCYTAPFKPVGGSNKASISLCRSRNLVLDSCSFFSGRRKGTLTKKFPAPAPGAVKLACDMVDIAAKAEKQDWLGSIHHDVWWKGTARDDAAVAAACAPGSPHVVDTPTLFVMRDRHANYAHEMEVVSMAFSFLAALQLPDVAKQGVQVVIVDQAPPTGFLETWARISFPHRLRILPADPFPPGTCFRSALHVYTFAAGIGYNTNGDTVACDSPVVTGLSMWLRQLYREGDVGSGTGGRLPHTPAGGIAMKNVVWLSRRNLELVRLLLNATAGWKAMRLVRNEDAVAAGLQAAVQEWNAESCLLRRFDAMVESEYQRSFTTTHSFRFREPGVTGAMTSGAANASSGGGGGSEAQPATGAAAVDAGAAAGQAEAVTAAGAGRQLLGGRKGGRRRRRTAEAEAAAAAGGAIDEHAGDGEDEGDEDEDGMDAAGGPTNATALMEAAAAGSPGGGLPGRPDYVMGEGNVIALERLWADDADCRKSNVLFKFVDGDFNDMPYHQQLLQIFRTGVLVGVHGAGLTHGFYMPPGQSAVLQLLGQSFAQVAANNVFRNMAANVGNFYQDVLYDGVDVNVEELKKAAKRAMDHVAATSLEAQLKRSGPPRLVLDDQSHFNVVEPGEEKCPAAAAAGVAGAGEGAGGGAGGGGAKKRRNRK